MVPIPNATASFNPSWDARRGISFSRDCVTKRRRAADVGINEQAGASYFAGNEAYTAPMLVGEFGVRHNDATTNVWWACIREYLAEKDFDWTYWPLNGTQDPGYN